MDGDASARWQSSPRGVATLWAGVLAGPIVWALDETISYSLVQWTCGSRHTFVLHTITLLSLAMITGGAALSWRAWSRASGERTPKTERTRFLALLGLVTSALFIVVVLATAIPRWVLDACQQ